MGYTEGQSGHLATHAAIDVSIAQHATDIASVATDLATLETGLPATFVPRGSLTLNIADFGGVADGGTTDNSPALNAAIASHPAFGVSVYLPIGANYYDFLSTISVTKPLRLFTDTGFLGTDTARLQFAAGVKGFDVHMADSAQIFALEHIALEGAATAKVTGSHGIHMKKGRASFRDVSVNNFAEHGVFYDSTTVGDNVNHSHATNLRCYSNRGDGIRLEGGDSNACTFIAPDTVANYGWGINNMSSHNQFLHPHADQQYNGSPGAYRDNGLSNDWDWVYAEASGVFLIDTLSNGGRVATSTFGAPTITKSGIAYNSWDIAQSGKTHRISMLPVEAGAHEYQFGQFVAAGSFDLSDATRGSNILSVSGSTGEATWWGSHMPNATATHDLGWAGGKWRTGWFSDYVRAGKAVITGVNTTALRPSATTVGVGGMVFDTTLNIPIWSDGSAWRNATGTVV
jgi:hypothetical protein